MHSSSMYQADYCIFLCVASGVEGGGAGKKFLYFRAFTAKDDLWAAQPTGRETKDIKKAPSVRIIGRAWWDFPLLLFIKKRELSPWFKIC